MRSSVSAATTWHELIYGQWLLQTLVGSSVGNSWGKDRQYPVPCFSLACMRLREAAESEDPPKQFGYKVASRMSSIFKLGRTPNSEKRIQRDLEKLVKQAAAIVDRTFETREQRQRGGTAVTYRRSNFDAQYDRFTYLPLDERAVPWQDDAEWGHLEELPEMSLEEASEEVLEALGFPNKTDIPAEFDSPAETGSFAGANEVPDW